MMVGRGGTTGGGSVCGLCQGVCHLLSYSILGIMCMVCVLATRACSWGSHSVRMLHYYLSSGGYESQGMVSRKREKMDGKGGGVGWCLSVWGADTRRHGYPSGPCCLGHKLSLR